MYLFFNFLDFYHKMRKSILMNYEKVEFFENFSFLKNYTYLKSSSFYDKNEKKLKIDIIVWPYIFSLNFIHEGFHFFLIKTFPK